MDVMTTNPLSYNFELQWLLVLRITLQEMLYLSMLMSCIR